MDYRDIIRSVREDRDDTQARIGEVLHKSQQGYSHIESGRAELKIDDLIKLCKFYDLSSVLPARQGATKEGTHPPARPVDVCLFYFRIHSVLPQPSVGCVDRLPCPAISSRHFTG